MRHSMHYIKENYTGPLVGAEIGIAGGNHARNMFENLDIKHLYLIDAILQSPLLPNLKKFSDKFSLIIVPSPMAAKEVKEQLDFVYIDADHSYDGAKNDLEAWYPKVKAGGVFCGHDYNYPGVEKAINEFAKSKDLKLFVKNNVPEEKKWDVVHKEVDFWMIKP